MCGGGGSSVGGIIGGAIGGPIGSIIGGEIGLGSESPDVPGLTGEERALLQKQGITLDKMNEILDAESKNIGANRDLLQQFSGLYTVDGKLDQGAVNNLKNKIFESQALQEGVSANALTYLKGVFNQNPYQKQSDQIAQTELSRYQKALEGNVPLTAAQQQQEKQSFERLKESAGQRGILLEGNDIYSATSQSTAGNQLLSSLRQDTNIQRQNLSEAELGRGYTANMGRLGLGLSQQGQLSTIAQQNLTSPGSSQLGFLQNSFASTPASLLPSYQGLASGFQSATDPYQQQRYLGFQNNLAQYGQKQQLYSDLLGLGGMLGGAAIGRK